jgi:hypothetical protein
LSFLVILYVESGEANGFLINKAKLNYCKNDQSSFLTFFSGFHEI